jgi:hypothetical protein
MKSQSKSIALVSQASIIAGTTTDLIFYPVDTVKIRLQSKEGFWKNGGFKGVWKGVGSVIVGSGPGGESSVGHSMLSLRLGKDVLTANL